MNKIPISIFQCGKIVDEGLIVNDTSLSVMRTAKDRGVFAFVYDAELGTLVASTPQSKTLQVSGFPTQRTIGRGEKGNEGTRGTLGKNGKNGTVGAVGAVGAQGNRGVKGKKGIVGPRGEEGYRGPMGRRGEKGDKGPRGYDGQPGNLGQLGYKGYAGNDVNKQVFIALEDPGAIGPNNLWFQVKAKRFYNPHLVMCGGADTLALPIPTATTTTTSTTSTTSTTTTTTTTTTTAAPVDYQSLPIVQYNLIDGSPLNYPSGYDQFTSAYMLGTAYVGTASISGVSWFKTAMESLDQPRASLDGFTANGNSCASTARGFSLSNQEDGISVLYGSIVNSNHTTRIPIPAGYNVEDCHVIASIAKPKDLAATDTALLDMYLLPYHDAATNTDDNYLPSISVQRVGGSLEYSGDTGLINYVVIASKLPLAILTGVVSDGSSIPLPAGDFSQIITFLSIRHVHTPVAMTEMACYANYDVAVVHANYKSGTSIRTVSGDAYYVSIGVP